MSELITAVYEKGILRPLQPLRLLEHETVLIHIVPQSGDPEIDRITAELVLDGALSLPVPAADDEQYVSDEELKTFAAEIGMLTGKSLSEMIIEEREHGW